MSKRSADGLYKRGSIWWGWRRLFPGGPLHRASTGCRDRQAARLVKAEWERAAADPVHHASNKTTLAEGIVMFLEDARHAKLSPHTLEMYESKCRHIARVLDGSRPLRSIVNATWRGYIKQREEEGASSHTIKKELIRGYGILRVAKQAGFYPHDLSTVMPRYSAGYEPRTRALTVEELHKLGAQLRADRLAHVAFVVATGCRLKESYRARPGHLLEEGFVYLDGTKTKRARRTIPIAPPLRPFLEFAIRNAPGAFEALFPLWHSARRDILAACKRAGIAPCTWNDLRRTNATLLAEAGVDSGLGSKLLGHVDGRMWEKVYAQPRPIALQRSLDAAFDGTETAHIELASRELAGKKADTALESSGLRSRRSEVQILCGAPEKLSNSVACADNAHESASAETPETAGLPYTNSTDYLRAGYPSQEGCAYPIIQRQGPTAQGSRRTPAGECGGVTARRDERFDRDLKPDKYALRDAYLIALGRRAARAS